LRAGSEAVDLICCRFVGLFPGGDKLALALATDPTAPRGRGLRGPDLCRKFIVVMIERISGRTLRTCPARRAGYFFEVRPIGVVGSGTVLAGRFSTVP
jgi:hypothetical protein